MSKVAKNIILLNMAIACVLYFAGSNPLFNIVFGAGIYYGAWVSR